MAWALDDSRHGIVVRQSQQPQQPQPQAAGRPIGRAAMARVALALALAAAVLLPTAPGLCLSFPAPVLAPHGDRTPEPALLAGPDAVYHNEGMPPIRSGSSTVVHSPPPPLLGLNVSHDATTFSVSVGGQAWLIGAPPAFHVQGRWWIAGINLTLAQSQRGTGTDPQLGDYEEVTATWSAGGVPIVTSWRLHPTTGALLFEQSFPQGANNTNLPQPQPWKPGDIALTDDISLLATAFPRFRTSGGTGDRMTDLGYLSFRYFWDLEMHGVGLAGFNRDGSVYGGVPLLLHDRDTLRSVVISPYENFKTAFTAQTNQPPLGADLACGIHGRVRALPVGFSHRTLLFAGAPQQPPGVRATLLAWGDLLLAKNGKQRVIHEASRSVPQTRLGYATATGAYYWYRTVDGKSYEQTMVDIHAAHKAERIPVGWYELDSWFYFKSGNATGEDGGCAEWTARPDIFPSGLPAVQQSALDGLPLMTHCKYFSADNVYQQRFPFLKDTESGLPDNATHALAIPLSVDFWNYIMSQAVHNGVVLWKQDWLASLFELSHKAGEDTNTARNFHVQMGAAAASHGIELQYCMPTTSDIIQTVESPTARFVRLSDDYCTNPLQWKIGRVALVAEALGLVAYKDAFWSQARQPGFRVQKDECWEGHFDEPNSLLHAAVASLSTGQVAFGDAIGHSNVSLIRMTCMDDGVLLRSDRQASAIDATFQRSNYPNGEVWRTEATVTAEADGSTVVFRYLLSANLTAAYVVPSDSKGLELGGQPHLAYDMLRRAEDQDESSSSWCCAELSGSGAELQLRRTEALGGVVPVELFVVCPLVHGFALLGEADKFLAVSPQRFGSLEISSDGLKVEVKRSAGSVLVEIVEVAVRLPSGAVEITACESPARAEAGPSSLELACSSTGCSCG